MIHRSRNSGPLFFKWWDVLQPDLAKARYCAFEMKAYFRKLTASSQPNASELCQITERSRNCNPYLMASNSWDFVIRCFIDWGMQALPPVICYVVMCLRSLINQILHVTVVYLEPLISRRLIGYICPFLSQKGLGNYNLNSWWGRD